MTRAANFAQTLTFCLAGVAAQADCIDTSGAQVEIYPTAKVLPENLLRMYVYYPRAMRTNDGQRHVTLLDRDGVEVEGVFLATRAELWSPDRQRLTLLLDPGRVKTGLAAHDTLGRALIDGGSYTLVVSGSAKDATGCALGADTRHSFVVGPADSEPPNPARWEMVEPATDTVQPLVVNLGSAHDHLSLAYRLKVRDGDGSVVPGKIALGAGEDSWMFTPRSPWASSPHTLTIDGRLEDLAGNRPGVLFDRPLAHEPEPWTRVLQFVPTS